MKIITFILLISCFSFLNLQAQDWHVVKQNELNYYFVASENNAPNSYLKRLLFINVESNNFINGDTVYNYYNTFSYTPIQSNIIGQLSFCVDTLTPSWLGHSTIRKSNGDEFFIINNLDSILIKTKAELNENWIFYHRRIDSLDFVATVTSVSSQTIDNSLDSVKTIQLSTFKNGILVQNNLNNPEIILSKNNGILKMYEYYSLEETNNTVFPATRIDKTKYIKNQSQVISDIDELYSAGNSWAFIEYSGYGPSLGVDNLYVYDSIINTQVLTSSQKKASIVRYKKYRNEFGEINYSSRFFDTILDFSFVSNRNLFDGIFPNKNIFSVLNNGIVNYNEKYYYINNEQTDIQLFCNYTYHDASYYPEFSNIENHYINYTYDSCINYSYYVGLGATSGDFYLKYDNQFGLISKMVNEYSSSTPDTYNYNYGLDYLRLGNVVVGNYPLPLSKIDIQAIAQKNNINQITWQTYEELNVDHFEIERSTNLVDFVKIGNLNSLGNSIEKQNYLFEDDVKHISNTSFLYRIKSVDIDGKYQFSNIVSLQKIKDDSFSIFPNPFYDNINLDINLKDETNYTIQMTNAVGVIVKNISGNLVSGNNKIQICDLKNLAKGIYYLQFSVDEKDTKTYKLIKL